MVNYTFRKWCEKAVCRIAFPPDRRKVEQELLDHLYDHFDTLIGQGYDREEARKQTLEAMGDAGELAAQFAAIHRPFWGYFLRATRILLVLLLAITVIPFIRFACSSACSEPQSGRFDPYSEVYLSDSVGITTRVLYSEPGQKVQWDGYTIKFSRAAWTNTQFASGEREALDRFYFQIEITNPRPWAEEPDIRQWIWARDSEGNVYFPFGAGTEGMHLSGNIYHTKPLTWLMDMQVYNFSSQDAEWIEICYNREGRTFAFRVELPGGAEQ